MRLGEIQAELKQRNISYADCFDKESLVKRLKDARDGSVKPSVKEAKKTEESAPSSDNGAKKEGADETSSTSARSSTFDRDAVLTELRSLRVKALRTKLSERNMRWAGLLEKEDLVRALADAMERAKHFSPSGALEPGKVTDIDDDQLEVEINRAEDAGTPLLLDVYATWCGPCQMMSPQLAAAASELGESVRVAKIDSDKYSQWAAKLGVGGLPTVLVFDSDGKEVNRVEGALMKDGLLDLVRPHT
jgi:thioredoxin